MTTYILRYSLLILLGLSACSKDFLEPTVSTAKDTETNVNTVGDLQALVYGVYDRMNESDYYGRDYIIYGDVRSDNAFSNGHSGRFVSIGQFVMTSADGNAGSTWEQIYQAIANTNIVIGAKVENNDSDEVKYVKGQAYFLRALAYMDLLRLYGQQNVTDGTLGVPIVTTFKDLNIYPVRATIDEVWNQIGADLQAAADHMNSSLDGETPAEVTSLAVAALQTRYYLYIKDYAKVVTAAEKVLDAYSIVSKANYKASWSADEQLNSIFELALSSTDNPGNNSLANMYQATGYGDIEATTNLYNLYEAGDVRKELFSVNGDVIRMVGKYPLYESNIPVIRYEEVILNYAEALVQLGSSAALTYLNKIPENRGASLYTDATLENVLLERRKEFALEGFRFFDLMRHAKGIPYADSRQTFSKDGIPFGSSKLAFPIPLAEVNANANVKQNANY